MQIAVQKFGGSSLASKEMRDKVVDMVIDKKQEGFMPVVVVSAIGRKGDPYATDTLIEIAKDSNPNVNPRELDLITSCGEVISSVLMANLLESKGYKSIALTGVQAGVITDDYFGGAEVLRVDTDNITKHLQDDIIPVVAGFQGVNKDGDITTLGRGGSDTTAAVIGGALKAKYVEIYTDVDGVMTADPNVVSKAKVIPKISYHEVFQMAEQGAKVIHPKSVNAAMKSNVTLVIKNTFGKSKGTYITNCDYDFENINPNEKIVTSVVYIPNRAQVFINESDINEVDLLQLLTDNNISIDLINFFNDRKVFTVNENEVDRVEHILTNENIEYEIEKDCTKVTVIGNKMRGIPGVMSKVAKALKKNDIEILQTSDSHATISCLIKSQNTQKAISAIHDEFNLEKD